MCCWVRAMESYDRVAKVVEPKRMKLAESEGQLEVVMTALRGKQTELQVWFVCDLPIRLLSCLLVQCTLNVSVTALQSKQIGLQVNVALRK